MNIIPLQTRSFDNPIGNRKKSLTNTGTLAPRSVIKGGLTAIPMAHAVGTQPYSEVSSIQALTAIEVQTFTITVCL